MSNTKQGTYYTQLVKGTALQLISNAVTRFGYHIEFVPVKDVSDSSEYAMGVDKALMRQRELIRNYIESEGTDNEAELRDKFKKSLDKTIVCLYNPTGMTLAEFSYNNDRSTPRKYLQETKALVGYRYAKVDAYTSNKEVELDTILLFDEVIEGGNEIIEQVIKVEEGADLESLRNPALEEEGLTLVKILKDIVKAKLSVDISFLVASERLLHNLQFILLKHLYNDTDQMEQSISVEYKIDGMDSNVIKQEYTYKLGELSSFGTVGSKNKSKLYTIGLSINDIQGTLLSDYNLYEPVEEIITYPITYLLKMGTQPIQTTNF